MASGSDPERDTAAQSAASPKSSEEQAITKAPLAPRIAGICTSAVIEIGLFIGVALGLDFAFFGGTRYATLNPHPYWIIVLLASVQYGTGEGLLAAVSSTLALVVGNMPEQTIDQGTYEFLLDVLSQPLMWFLSVVVIGALRNRQLRERTQLYDSLGQTERRLHRATTANERLSRQKESLEVRVAGQLSTFVKTYQAAQAIERSEPGEVLLGVVDVIRAVIRAEKFSLFLLNNNILEAAIQDGWEAEDSYSRVLDQRNGLFQEVVGQRRFLSISSESDELVLGNEGVLAGPLVSAESDDVIGILKIEEMNLLDLNVSTVENFCVLTSWIGSAYAKALVTATTTVEPGFYVGRGVIPHRYFSTQHYFLVSIARRIGFDVSAVLVHLTNAAELPPDLVAEVPVALSEAVRLSLGAGALVFEHEHGGNEFVVLLPGTTLANANEAAERLLNSLRAQLGARAVSVGLEATVQSLYHQQRQEAARERVAG